MEPTQPIPRLLLPHQDTLLDDTYQIKDWLGSGGMGVVAIALDIKLNRDVAIKFILPVLASRDEVRSRFVYEARAMARVRHANVVAIHSFGVTDADILYFVMEYVPGLTIQTLLEERNQAPLDPSEAIRILRQLCCAVDAIHRSGTVHRDLKPSNIIIGSGFRVAVTDFGLASSLQFCQSQEPTHGFVGTPAYASPEALCGLEPGRAGDIYSLAVITYELLAGRHPFDGTTAADLMRQHLYELPPHPSDLRPELPKQAGDVIMRGLDKDPTGRPPSAREFLRPLLDAFSWNEVSSTPLRFLIADDDPNIRMLLTAILEDIFPHAALDVAENGTAALACMNNQQPSLAIIDLQMPGLNGVELTASIRSDPVLRTVPIIVMTAVGGAPDWQILSSLGANAFIVKPFEPDALIVTIRRLLNLPATLLEPDNDPDDTERLMREAL